MMSDDMDIVRKFAASQSEPAFATLVQRHIGLVHSAAMRQVGDAHLAEEIAQAVFIILARKATTLGPKTILAAWLYRTTRYAAADALRTQRRRQAREQEAHMQSILNQPDADTWAQLAPLLDDAMAQLGETDRAALVLRFFENKTMPEIAGEMRVAEAAAQKRVARALEKLRAIFVKQGVTLSAVALGGTIAANSVQAVPAGLTTTISAATMKGAAVAASVTTVVNGTIKTIAMTTLQKTLITAALVVAVGTTIYEAHNAATMRTEVKTLQSQQAEQIQQLKKERDDAMNRVAGLLAENSKFQLNQNQSELLKLRGEIGLLRARLADAKNPSQQPPLSTSKEYYNRAGTHYINHDYEAQLEDLNKAIELDPNMAEAYFMRGSLYASNLPKERGGYEKAIADYSRCLEIKPNDASARWNRATYYKSLGQPDKAISDWTIYIEGDTDFSLQGQGKTKSIAGAYFWRGDVYQNYKHDYSNAISDYTAALQLDPNREWAHRARGKCYEKLGEFEKVQQDFAADPDKSN